MLRYVSYVHRDGHVIKFYVTTDNRIIILTQLRRQDVKMSCTWNKNEIIKQLINLFDHVSVLRLYIKIVPLFVLYQRKIIINNRKVTFR